jgi:hypothetical protein
MPRLPFIPNAYAGRSVDFESQRIINFFPELANAPGAKNIAALVGTPGLRVWFASNSPPVRGAMGFNGLCYAVVSNKLLSIATDGITVVILGTLQTSSGRISIKNNGLASAGVGGNQICIVDGTAGYIYNVVSGVFSTISTAGGFPANPVQIEYMDGYFIVIDGSMSSWTSELYNGITWNALTKNPVQAAPDNIQSPLNLHQQLFFVKEYTTEVYYNTATPTSQGSPFSRVGGAVIDFGTMAPWSVSRGDNSAFFLANQRGDEGGSFVGVVELNGYVPMIISPPAITYRMGLSTDLTQCFGYVYYDEGHTFYVLTNPVDNWTFVYDTTTQMWHERSTVNLVDNTVHRHLGNCYVRFHNMHLVGDYYSSNLYEMNTKYHTDAGLPIVSEHTTQRLAEEDYLEDIFIGELKIDVESGVGMAGVNSPAVAYAVVAAGAVTGCVVTYNGADYTSVPTVILRSTDGTGAGATAVATVNSGSVTQVLITNGGSGYTSAPEVILAMPEVAPIAGLSISNNGGHTWGSESVRSMGKVGEYRKRMIWRGVGRSKDRVFRLRISSPVKKIVLGYYVEPA